SISLGAAACSVTTSHDIDPGNLSGVVGGQTWSFQAGATDGFLSHGETDFYAPLYPVPFTPCGISGPRGPHLILSLRDVAADSNPGLARNRTFVDGTANLDPVAGRIIVDVVTADHVSGGLRGTYDVDNEVNGQFDVTICPEN